MGCLDTAYTYITVIVAKEFALRSAVGQNPRHVAYWLREVCYVTGQFELPCLNEIIDFYLLV